MIRFKKFLNSLLLLSVAYGASASPIIPSEATFKYAYEQMATVEVLDGIEEKIASSTGQTKIALTKELDEVKTLPLNIPRYVAVFEESNGQIVKKEISADQYSAMEKKGGVKANPTEVDFVSLLDLATTQEVQSANAFDDVSQGESAAITSLTFAHDIAASNEIIWGYTYLALGTPDDLSSIAYNGDNLTFVQKNSKPSSSEVLYQYYLLNPDTGTNNIVFTRGSSGIIIAFSTSYTGAVQSGQPDGTDTQSTSGTTVTTTVTTSVNNSWMSMAGFYDSGNPTASTNSTQRGTTALIGPMAVYDNNTDITPAGAYGMTQTVASSGIVTVGAGFAPFVAATADETYFEVIE